MPLRWDSCSTCFILGIRVNGNGKLLADIDRNGNAGLGHPEPLKGNLAGWWSREIDEKNRLIYKIEDGCIKIFQCKNHYADR
ncbi:MAG: Txe/YoeB family addiction module toxin [Spirochaetaceae bacterium]|nr:Txe/YoeB family addiction module toxin [Spirochaetaceae bacterium]